MATRPDISKRIDQLTDLAGFVTSVDSLWKHASAHKTVHERKLAQIRSAALTLLKQRLPVDKAVALLQSTSSGSDWQGSQAPATAKSSLFEVQTRSSQIPPSPFELGLQQNSSQQRSTGISTDLNREPLLQSTNSYTAPPQQASGSQAAAQHQHLQGSTLQAHQLQEGLLSVPSRLFTQPNTLRRTGSYREREADRENLAFDAAIAAIPEDVLGEELALRDSSRHTSAAADMARRDTDDDLLLALEEELEQEQLGFKRSSEMAVQGDMSEPRLQSMRPPTISTHLGSSAGSSSAAVQAGMPHALSGMRRLVPMVHAKFGQSDVGGQADQSRGLGTKGLGGGQFFRKDNSSGQPPCAEDKFCPLHSGIARTRGLQLLPLPMASASHHYQQLAPQQLQYQQSEPQQQQSSPHQQQQSAPPQQQQQQECHPDTTSQSDVRPPPTASSSVDTQYPHPHQQFPMQSTYAGNAQPQQQQYHQAHTAQQQHPQQFQQPPMPGPLESGLQQPGSMGAWTGSNRPMDTHTHYLGARQPPDESGPLARGLLRLKPEQGGSGGSAAPAARAARPHPPQEAFATHPVQPPQQHHPFPTHTHTADAAPCGPPDVTSTATHRPQFSSPLGTERPVNFQTVDGLLANNAQHPVGQASHAPAASGQTGAAEFVVPPPPQGTLPPRAPPSADVASRLSPETFTSEAAPVPTPTSAPRPRSKGKPKMPSFLKAAVSSGGGTPCSSSAASDTSESAAPSLVPAQQSEEPSAHLADPLSGAAVTQGGLSTILEIGAEEGLTSEKARCQKTSRTANTVLALSSLPPGESLATGSTSQVNNVSLQDDSLCSSGEFQQPHPTLSMMMPAADPTTVTQPESTWPSLVQHQQATVKRAPGAQQSVEFMRGAAAAGTPPRARTTDSPTPSARSMARETDSSEGLSLTSSVAERRAWFTQQEQGQVLSRGGQLSGRPSGAPGRAGPSRPGSGRGGQAVAQQPTVLWATGMPSNGSPRTMGVAMDAPGWSPAQEGSARSRHLQPEAQTSAGYHQGQGTGMPPRPLSPLSPGFGALGGSNASGLQRGGSLNEPPLQQPQQLRRNPSPGADDRPPLQGSVATPNMRSPVGAFVAHHPASVRSPNAGPPPPQMPTAKYSMRPSNGSEWATGGVRAGPDLAPVIREGWHSGPGGALDTGLAMDGPSLHSAPGDMPSSSPAPFHKVPSSYTQPGSSLGGSTHAYPQTTMLRQGNAGRLEQNGLPQHFIRANEARKAAWEAEQVAMKRAEAQGMQGDAGNVSRGAELRRSRSLSPQPTTAWQGRTPPDAATIALFRAVFSGRAARSTRPTAESAFADDPPLSPQPGTMGQTVQGQGGDVGDPRALRRSISVPGKQRQGEPPTRPSHTPPRAFLVDPWAGASQGPPRSATTGGQSARDVPPSPQSVEQWLHAPDSAHATWTQPKTIRAMPALFRTGGDAPSGRHQQHEAPMEHGAAARTQEAQGGSTGRNEARLPVRPHLGGGEPLLHEMSNRAMPAAPRTPGPPPPPPPPAVLTQVTPVRRPDGIYGQGGRSSADTASASSSISIPSQSAQDALLEQIRALGRTHLQPTDKSKPRRGAKGEQALRASLQQRQGQVGMMAMLQGTRLRSSHAVPAGSLPPATAGDTQSGLASTQSGSVSTHSVRSSASGASISALRAADIGASSLGAQTMAAAKVRGSAQAQELFRRLRSSTRPEPTFDDD